MDQIKIGKFIGIKRKEKGLTQEALAEKLGISNRAISKWENGICMPDSGNIPELCNILNITINDLFSGEIVDMKNKDKKLEENMLELIKQKEEKDKQLLKLEYVIVCTASVMFLALIFVASYIEMPMIIRVLLIIMNCVLFAIGICYAIKIEQTAGYYECVKCHNKYIPKYNSVLFSMHFGRTRYMKCPKCNKKSWNKKIISK